METVPLPQNLLTQIGPLPGGLLVPISPNDNSGRLGPFSLQKAMPSAGTPFTKEVQGFLLLPGHLTIGPTFLHLQPSQKETPKHDLCLPSGCDLWVLCAGSRGFEGDLSGGKSTEMQEQKER